MSKRPILLFVIFLYLVGFVFGTIAVVMMPLNQKLELKENFLMYLDPVAQIDEMSQMWNPTIRYFSIGIAITLLGLSVIGVPLVLLYLFVKGFLLGFTSAFIISQLGGEGILFVAYTLLPQNALLVPALMFFTASCIHVALFIIKNRLIKFQGILRPQFMTYFTSSFGIIVTLVIVGLYENIIFPKLYDYFL